MRLFILLFSFLFISNFAFAAEGEEKGDGTGIEYMEITPKFVVNLIEPKKYLSINVQLLIEGKETSAKIKKHMPALKHELIMLFSDRSMDSLQTMEQREALRQESIDVIHKTIDKAEGVEESEEVPVTTDPHKKTKAKDYSHLPSAGFKDAFFTEFLLQ
ncbi:MAG: flagellar basal body-associated FliL family protein [Methylococcales bacterium]|nr:flagellar basal body-associated FliL family protein [Methylococcales bacterium]MDD5754446.1 flagellar basal body-associated FliL family protein [Methylococcales bacterium]